MFSTVSHETLLASKTFLWSFLKTLNPLPIVRAFLKEINHKKKEFTSMIQIMFVEIKILK